MHANTISHGDCVSVLPASVDPSLPTALSRELQAARRARLSGDDNAAWLKPSFAEMHRVLKANGFCFSFYGWPHARLFHGHLRLSDAIWQPLRGAQLLCG